MAIIRQSCRLLVAKLICAPQRGPRHTGDPLICGHATRERSPRQDCWLSVTIELVNRPCPTLLLQSSGRARSNRSGMPVMAWLHQRTVWQLCRLRMIVWALDAVSADAGHRCPALLPTRVIAGQGVRASFATERAPRIRVRRLRAANLCFAQKRSGNDKRCDDRHPHHGALPVVVLGCLRISSSGPPGREPPRAA